MAFDANFAFVGSFSQGFINAALRAYQANLLPPTTVTLPTLVTVDGTSVGMDGTMIVLPPQVSLEARSDNLVTVMLGVAGTVMLTGGGQFAQAEIILETTLLVGLVTNVQTVGSAHSITVGIDLSAASVTFVDVGVFVGPPLIPLFTSVFGSPDVLNVLTQAVRAIPSSLLQVTPGGFSLPIAINQTYQPPGGSIFFPDTLFAFQFDVQRIVARPVNSTNPGAGALVVGVDTTKPVSTFGDQSQLVDLNTTLGPAGNVVDEEPSGATFTGGGLVNHESDIAIAVNGTWLSSIVNNVISPQLASKFPEPLADNHLSFGANALNLNFGTFNPPLNSPWSPPIPTSAAVNGIIITADLVYHSGTLDRDANGYYIASSGGIETKAQLTADAAAIQLTSSVEDPPEPPPLPSGVAVGTVSFSANPAGAQIGLDNYLVILGLGASNYRSRILEIGQHTIATNPAFFQSWNTIGNVSIDNPSSASANLTVNGDGAITLQQSNWNPYVDNNRWTIGLISTGVKVPWYIAPILFFVGSTISSFPGGMAALGILGGFIANQNNKAAGPLASALNSEALLQDTILNLPDTSAPLWDVEIADFAFSPEGVGLYVDVGIATSESLAYAGGFVGNIPYLLVTNQEVTDPTSVPDFQGPSGFPVRFDGTFSWPVLRIPDSGGNLEWDVQYLNPIGVVLKVPPGLFNPQDPSVYVEWTVVRTDTNAVLISKTLGIGQGDSPANIFSINIDHASAALQAADGFSISCRLFRPHTTSIEEIFNISIGIPIQDIYDRNHPYVQWGGNGVTYVAAGYPFWDAVPKGVIPQRWVKSLRQSRIHRTDVWRGGGRCLVANMPFYVGIPKKGPGKGMSDWSNMIGNLSSGWTYIDTLPISLDSVRQNRNLARGVLCDYCFFGGPTKTQLRTDFPFMV